MNDETESKQFQGFSTVSLSLRYRLKQPVWYPYEAALIFRGYVPEDAGNDWRHSGICAFQSYQILEHFRLWGLIDSWRITTESNDGSPIVMKSWVRHGIPDSGGYSLPQLQNMRAGAFTEVHIEGNTPRPPLEWIECYLEFPRYNDYLHPLMKEFAKGGNHKGAQRQQEEDILNALRKLGHDPLKLNLFPHGKGKPGPKLEARKLIGKKMTVGVFDKAWERLCKFDEIKTMD